MTLVSEYVKGWRLADLLDVAETENLTFDIGVVMLLLRQLLPTAAMLSNQSRDTASGALGPEHLLLTPQGRVVLTDYVLGPAIDTLGWDPERLWRTLRVATPPGTDARGRFAAWRRRPGRRHRAVAGGRPAPARRRVPRAPRRAGRQRPPAHPVRGRRAALGRAAQLAHPRAAAGTQRSFATLFDARLALEQLLATESALIAQPTELDRAMARLERLMPAFELPALPAVSTARRCLDMPAPGHDWVAAGGGVRQAGQAEGRRPPPPSRSSHDLGGPAYGRRRPSAPEARWRSSAAAVDRGAARARAP